MRIQILILEFKGLRHQFPRTSICDEFKCNLQVYLLFSDSKTMATLVNYTCKSVIKLTPGWLSPRVWRPAVLVKTRVWVGCSVSRAHKTWSTAPEMIPTSKWSPTLKGSPNRHRIEISGSTWREMGIISGLGIISGSGSFRGLYRVSVILIDTPLQSRAYIAPFGSSPFNTLSLVTLTLKKPRSGHLLQH